MAFLFGFHFLEQVDSRTAPPHNWTRRSLAAVSFCVCTKADCIAKVPPSNVWGEWEGEVCSTFIRTRDD